MRDPADVIADALYRLGLDQGNDAANGAVDVLLALRDEYGTWLATTAPDPMSAGMVIRCIPVPAEEGTDAFGERVEGATAEDAATAALAAADQEDTDA